MSTQARTGEERSGDVQLIGNGDNSQFWKNRRMAKLTRVMAFVSCFLLAGSAVFAGTCPSNVPSGVTFCFYADFVSGSDSNDGASEANGHPWQHLPGMAGCTGNCASNTPSGGKGYILKGGSIWTKTALPWAWNWSGASSGAPVYIGYDPAWNQGVVNAVIPTSSGYNCTAITVGISGGGGSGAAGTANFMTANYLAGLLQHITLSNQGSGYTSNPTVSFAGSICTVLPTAIADIQRPIIDATGTTWNTTNGAYAGYGPIVFAGNYQVIDHLEFRGMLADYTLTSGQLDLVTLPNSTGELVVGVYLHNFGPNYISESGTPSFNATGGLGINQGEVGTVTVTNSILDNYENEVTGSYCGWNGTTAGYYAPPCGSSFGIAGATTFTNNIVHDSRGQVYAPAQSGLVYTGNTIWSTTADCCGQHPDTFYFWGSGIIANNVIHDEHPQAASGIYVESCLGSSCSTGVTDYIFNNVEWNPGWGSLSISSEEWTSQTMTSNPTFYIWNNTFYSNSGTNNCIGAGQFYGNSPTAPMYFNLYNNHCISDQTGMVAFGINDAKDCTTASECGTWNGLSNPNGSTTQAALATANLVMTPSNATSQNYVIANQLASTSTSNGTVKASGTNLTSSSPGCSTSGLSNLCTDVRGVSRPVSGGGAWNMGAYQYLSGKVPQPPSAVVGTPVVKP